jgi:hypothetical protein
MLADVHRLSAYREAIEKVVGPHDCVADLGTGTGILASYAAQRTSGPVYAVEYFDETAQVAEEMALRAGFDQIRIIRDNALSCKLPDAPRVLITETVGPVGPEERIVELAYGFTSRFPSVEVIVPSVLEIFAVPIRSETVDRIYGKFLRSFDQASHDAWDYRAVDHLIDYASGSQIFTADLSGADILDDCISLARFRLGYDGMANFSKSLTACRLANAVHIFFRITLVPGVELSSFLSDKPTHWLHSFIRIPSGCRHLQISYESARKRWNARWTE